MQAALWLAFCVVVAILMRRQPFALALLSLTLWCLLPGVAVGLIVGDEGNLLEFHPAASLTVVVVAVQLSFRSAWMLRSALYRPEWTVLLGTVGLIAASLGVLGGRGKGAITAGIDQLAGPVFLFFLIGAALLEQPRRLEALRAWFLAMALGQALLSLAQAANTSTIFFQTQYSDQEWFTPEFLRWMGTLDHPLVLSLLLVIAIPLSAGLRRPAAIVLLPCIFLAGLLVTESRAGAALGVLGTVYVLLTAPLSRRWRVTSFVALGAAALVAVRMGLAGGLTERIIDDTGSAEARMASLKYGLEYLSEHWWIGGGLSSSYDVARAASLELSFENSLIMYAIDLGLIPALMYFSVMVLAAARAFVPGAPSGLAGAAAAALIAPQAFSALSGATAAPAIVWAVLAMSGFHTSQLRVAAAADSPPGWQPLGVPEPLRL